MPPLEAWEKVLVDPAFLSSVHGRIACVDCHSGQAQAPDMEAAHAGLTAQPTAGAAEACDVCHGSMGQRHQQSLHGSLAGYRETIRVRSGQAEFPAGLEQMFEKNCATCHTTCGQCHVSRPKSVGGGFIGGHQFLKRPSMNLNCTACHGSRVGEEYRGQHAGFPADVHYNRGMQCTACHAAEEVHATDPPAAHRYETGNGPACEDCHSPLADNLFHARHADNLSCQVCHSQPYKNCYSCHVGKESKGLTRPSELDFKIGRNVRKGPGRNYDYAVVRHIPIAPDSYDEWVPGVLANFAALPTWKYATPHNIRKRTPQAENCTSSCHNNESVFLLESDLSALPPVEQEANRSVVVRKVPR